MHRRLLGALKEGLNSLTHTRGPDTAGIGVRAAQRLQHAEHKTRQALSYAHALRAPDAATPQSLHQSVKSIFHLIAPNLSSSARAILQSGPTSQASVLAHSQSTLGRGISLQARTAFRPGFGVRPGLPVIKSPVHHVGLGTARGFATGAGRPVFQNIQNAPQYLRAIADQKDKLKKGKLEHRQARKAKKGDITKSRQSVKGVHDLHTSLFPTATPASSSQSPAIVLTVSLEPSSAAIESADVEADTFQSTSLYNAQGHLLNAAFLRVLRSREEQLARAGNVFSLVQDAVAEGTARCKMHSAEGGEHKLVVMFDARLWTIRDVRALLGLWDDMRDVWYGLHVDEQGWTSEVEMEDSGVSDVTTLSGISIEINSSASSPTRPFSRMQPPNHRQGHDQDLDRDHDTRAHDAVLETLQLPSIMFGASFVDHPPTTSMMSYPSPSRSSSYPSALGSLSSLGETSEFGSDDDRDVRDFIDQVNDLAGGFPSQERFASPSNQSSEWSTVGSGFSEASALHAEFF